MVKEPRPAGKRSEAGTEFTITLLNWEAGDVWNVDQAGWLGQSAVDRVVSGHETNEVIIPGLDAEGKYIFFVTLNNAPLPVAIISSHLDETPPYYTVEATGTATLVAAATTINLPWADPIETILTEVEGAAVEGNLSQPMASFGKNQTL